MSTVLCEQCFPDWDKHEIYTIGTPLSACVECGRFGGTVINLHPLKAHMFRTDPRKKFARNTCYRCIPPTLEENSKLNASDPHGLGRSYYVTTCEKCKIWKECRQTYSTEPTRQYQKDQAFMKCAEAFAELSRAVRLKVGAVIVKDGQIISCGFNGTRPGADNCCEEWIPNPNGITRDMVQRTKPDVIHAEMNAMYKLAKGHESSEGATLYATHEPCLMCSSMINGIGIKRVVYRDNYVGPSGKGSGIEFLKNCGIVVEKL